MPATAEVANLSSTPLSKTTEIEKIKNFVESVNFVYASCCVLAPENSA
jgi:hypothetical protein